MAEYSRIAKGHFTSTGAAQIVNLPFQPDAVEWWNLTLISSNVAASEILEGYWDVSMGQGTGLVQGYSSGSVLIMDNIPSNGISTFAAGQLLQYGALQGHNQGAITDFSITAASPAVVTATGHGLATGNVIIFENLYQTATTGMQQMAGVPLTVTVVNANSFSVNWNASGSNYTAFNTATSTGNVGTYKQVLYPYLYAPNQAVITGMNITVNQNFTAPANSFQTAAAHNLHVGQEVAFRIPPAWGSSQLNSLPDVLIPGSPIYYYVIAVTQNTFTVSQSLASVTVFNPNQPFAGARTLPQVIPAGDFNTGGTLYSGGNLYPSPNVYNGAGTAEVPTINGPAILGSFVNATSQGFIIGAGVGRVITAGSTVGANTNVIYWRAYLSDLAVN
jgi:hypothetical protein